MTKTTGAQPQKHNKNNNNNNKNKNNHNIRNNNNSNKLMGCDKIEINLQPTTINSMCIELENGFECFHLLLPLKVHNFQTVCKVILNYSIVNYQGMCQT